MSILVYAESQDGKFKKSSYEAISYAKAFAGGTPVVAIVMGNADASELAKYGAHKVLHIESLSTFDVRLFASAIAQAATQEQSEWVSISNTYTGKSIAPRVAVLLKAGIVSGAVELPVAENNIYKVRKSCFSGKGLADVTLHSGVKVVAITPNSYKVVEHADTGSVSAFAPILPPASTHTVELKRVTGKIPLTEAEIVVSGGRGWKGPENWGMIEELASLLGGATACSKPVADVNWRPHEEHVGQTGITIKPNLYIATGISGAIQHQAGVSGSKVIVVINKDPEAPFFKIADYGIVGDVFEVMPKIVEAAREYKSKH